MLKLPLVGNDCHRGFSDSGLADFAIGDTGCQLLAFMANIDPQSQHEVIAQPAREREELLRAIVETAVDAIISIDARGTMLSFNPAASRLFGYSPDEAIGQNISLLMPSPHREEHDFYIARYLRTGEARIIGIGRELVAQHKDGSMLPVELAVSQIDRLGRFTGILRDVRERKELERQLAEATEDEQRRIAHELHDGVQQDLVGLGMLAEVLGDSLAARSAPEAAQAQRIARGIAETNRKIRLLAKNLLPVEVDAQGLAVALQEAAARCREMNRIDCQFEGDTRAEVSNGLVATQLYAIAHEAITNAVKHAQCRQIRVRLGNQGGQLTLEVRDNGVGFETSRTSKGVGLHIMAYRASLIGATLAIRRRMERGTIVTCTLPG